MLDYLDVLAELHVAQRPHSYLEIGVSRGDSFRLASDEAICVGVDPEPELDTDDPCRSNVEIMTSDEFFASGRLRDRFGERPVDMVFIDGMHLFEYALRDFTNAEAIAAPGSLIVLHDCLPRDAVTSSRERTTAHWTGDVWKLPLCLLDERPDLELTIIDVPPSGLCLVRRLDPDSKTLPNGYERLVEAYQPLEFAEWESRRDSVIDATTHGPESRLWSLAKSLDDRLEQTEAKAVAETDRLQRLLADGADREARAAEELAQLRVRLAESEALKAHLEASLEVLATSTSWRLTAPLRRGADLFRRATHRGDDQVRPSP